MTILIDDAGSIQGSTASGLTSDDNTPTLEGTAEAGASKAGGPEIRCGTEGSRISTARVGRSTLAAKEATSAADRRAWEDY